jgi:uncharacterized protein (DUF2237 family)
VLTQNMANNVLGQALHPCSIEPKTGFFRDGCCHASADDRGMHTLCAVMTEEFLQFSILSGNDLSTPHPEFHFPGLKAGDRWCLCLGRWMDALKAGKAPPVVLEATHASVVEFVDIEILHKYRNPTS